MIVDTIPCLVNNDDDDDEEVEEEEVGVRQGDQNSNLLWT